MEHEDGGLTADRPALAAGRDDDAHQGVSDSAGRKRHPPAAPCIGLDASRNPMRSQWACTAARSRGRAASSLSPVGPPVVEDPGYVQDVTRPLADPERDVPLRRAPSEAEKPPTSSNRDLRKKLRRPVYGSTRSRSGEKSGLKKGLSGAPRIDLVLVGIDEVGLPGP